MRGVRANLDAAGGGTYLIFPLGKLKVKKTRMSSNLAVPKTKKIMNNQTIRKLTIMKNKVSRCSSSLMTQWNALQYGE